MTETVDLLESKIRGAIVPGARGRLLERGLARGLIWQEGVVPASATEFSNTLTDDLLDYGNVVLAMSLRLRDVSPGNGVLPRALLVAGETIEAAVHRGDPSRLDSGLGRITAAVAFHLGRYAARAYSVLPRVAEENLAPTEVALAHLLRRSLDDLRSCCSEWLMAEEHSDDGIASRLSSDPKYGPSDAIHEVLTTAFMANLALFDHALRTGDETAAENARSGFRESAATASAMSSVPHWWTHTLASHLVDDFWNHTFHQALPSLPPDEEPQLWNELRLKFIDRLYCKQKSAVDLWPSQLEAAVRATDETDNLVVALPTGAGKTRIAELCILRALASGRRAIYVTPLRALSSQVEQDLADTFGPLGVNVVSLYGAAGIEAGDSETLKTSRLVVATPEKLDFAIRNNEEIIDDVGLVVLDEGHMLGPEEREVRYEAFVQRLLKRADAPSRRVVCLSALFPEPSGMVDLVSWLRRDEPGEPLHSTWRPTRQRFGAVTWQHSSKAARLDVVVEDDEAFVRAFVEASPPPQGSRRRNDFPANKNDLTLATAWTFVEQDKQVLIYCVQRNSVGTLGKHVLTCIRQGVLTSLGRTSPDVQRATATGAEWLGEHHPAVLCLKHGVALHHAGLPRQFLSDVESLIRSGHCRVTISSPTLAQGVNIPCAVLLIPSIWRNKKKIKPVELANVAGRAGRAFVDLEGLVVHVVHEETTRKAKRCLEQWWGLVGNAKAMEIESGLLSLLQEILGRIGLVTLQPPDKVLEYLTGNASGWSFPPSLPPELVSQRDWENDIASLDSALLALLDLETEADELAHALTQVLDGSFFGRRIARLEERLQAMLHQLLCLRAQLIWAETTVDQRRGYYLAGVGLSAGRYVDLNKDHLLAALLDAEKAINTRNAPDAAEAILRFAEVVFGVAPFEPREFPDQWREMLSQWIQGASSSSVIALGGDFGVDFLQDALVYRLAWAAEAVRVHAVTNSWPDADKLMGICAMAIETGNANPSVITLVRAGLKSRQTAIDAVETTSAVFSNKHEMIEWMVADPPNPCFQDPSWPAPEGRAAWTRFAHSLGSGMWSGWSRAQQTVAVTWSAEPPATGTYVRIHSPEAEQSPQVLSTQFARLGSVDVELDRSPEQITQATVSGDNVVDVSYFGPTPPPAWLDQY